MENLVDPVMYSVTYIVVSDTLYAVFIGLILAKGHNILKL